MIIDETPTKRSEPYFILNCGYGLGFLFKLSFFPNIFNPKKAFKRTSLYEQISSNVQTNFKFAILEWC